VVMIPMVLQKHCKYEIVSFEIVALMSIYLLTIMPLCIKIAYMSMLVTTTPILKMFKLFPKKTQPPNILHTIAHKLSNLGPSHNGHM
jgi:hypothetical protein